jgi:protein gp37
MGKDSRIEWTHHTFNPWWGCTKVSQACKFCYAEVWAKRTGQKLWGPKAERRFFGAEHWKQPLNWDREAKAAGLRRRVFCASMADVFEYRAELQPWREKLWDLIEQTPNLDWLLLTKRPQRIGLHNRWGGGWPTNVWLGTTVENQTTAAERIPHLLENSAHVRFLSCEPLIGPVDLTDYLGFGIQWVIAGGESGGRSRPSHPRWISDLRDQCTAAKVRFLFKQWGNWAPYDSKVADSGKRVHIFPDGAAVIRRTKKDAGRLLKGRTWDQVPESFNGAVAAVRIAPIEQKASARF